MNKKSFADRGAQGLGALDFSLPEEALYQGQVESLQRMAQMGLNRTCFAEIWPTCGFRLIDFADTIPEISTAELQKQAQRNRRVFAAICAKARELGIEPYVSMTTINYPDSFGEHFGEAAAEAPAAADRWLRDIVDQDVSCPSGGGLAKTFKICPSSQGWAQLLEAQLTELCRIEPLAGIMWWFSAANCDPFYCNCEKCRVKSASQILIEFTNQTQAVCKRFEKKLLLHCYLGSWRCGLETEVWQEAAQEIPPEVEIIYKQQQGDMYDFHPANPLAGKLGRRTEIVEFDLFGEYRGNLYGMVCSIGKFFAGRIRHFHDLGVPAIMGRGAVTNHDFAIDPELFGALASNTDLDVDTWCRDWARDRYGAAGEEVLAILEACGELCRLSMYVAGVNWSSWAVPQSLARLRFILFDRSAPCVPGCGDALQPTDENIRRIIEEKEQAVGLSEEIVHRCEALEGKLSERYYQPLLTSCLYWRAYTLTAAPLVETFFRFLKWEKTSSDVSREYFRVPLLESIARCRSAIEQSLAQVGRLEHRHLDRLSWGTVDEKAAAEPFNNARTVIDDISKEIDIEPSMYWSVYPWPQRWPKSLRDRQELYRG